MTGEPLESLFLILLEEPGPNLREAVQEMVKQNTSEWWHQMPDAWIVQGGTAAQWRDRIKPLRIAAGAATSVLVLSLPPLARRSWAGLGPPGTWDWFYGHYTAKKKD